MATKRLPSGPFRHLIGGEAGGKPHEAGDRVSESVPQSKLAEWFKAGLIAPIPKKERKTDE